MKTAKEFLQNKYPQMRGEKWNSHAIIDDNWTAQMMEEYAAQPKWISDEEIENAHSKMINVSKSVGFVNGAKWMRDKLCTPPEK